MPRRQRTSALFCASPPICAASACRVPAILAADEADGLVLEEDLGDDLLSLSCWTGATPSRPVLLDAAVDALVVMQRAAAPDGLPSWDAAAMASTAHGHTVRLVVAGAVRRPRSRGGPRRRRHGAGDDAGTGRRRAHAASSIGISSPATCCRTWPDRRVSGSSTSRAPPSGTRPTTSSRCCRTPAATSRPACQRSRSATVSGCSTRIERSAISDAAFAACAAQRHLRVACQWVRLALRDNRPQYLVHGPRTWRLLNDALSQPAAAPLAAALNRWIPAAARQPTRTAGAIAAVASRT